MSAIVAKLQSYYESLRAVYQEMSSDSDEESATDWDSSAGSSSGSSKHRSRRPSFTDSPIQSKDLLQLDTLYV